MAHVTLHFSIGMMVVTLWMGKSIVKVWQSGRPLGALTGRCLLLSLALGFYACLPSLFRRAGVPAEVCDGWWMNVFLGYSFIKRAFTFGGMPLGALAVTCAFGGQYVFLLAAIARAKGQTSKLPS